MGVVMAAEGVAWSGDWLGHGWGGDGGVACFDMNDVWAWPGAAGGVAGPRRAGKAEAAPGQRGPDRGSGGAMAAAGWAPPRLDEFILTEPLGSGTYATVYKAYRKVGPSPPLGSPFCSRICTPHARGTPVFQCSTWGTTPIALAWHLLPL